MVAQFVQERRIASFCVSDVGFTWKYQGFQRVFVVFSQGKLPKKIGTTNHPDGVAMDISWLTMNQKMIMKYPVDGRNPAPGNVQNPVNNRDICHINPKYIFHQQYQHLQLSNWWPARWSLEAKSTQTPQAKVGKKHSFLATTCFEIAATARKWWVWRGQEIKTEFTLKLNH